MNTPNCGPRDVRNACDSILRHVLDVRQYGFDAAVKTSFNFEVKACTQIAVYVTENPIVAFSTETYSTYLGEEVMNGTK